MENNYYNTNITSNTDYMPSFILVLPIKNQLVTQFLILQHRINKHKVWCPKILSYLIKNII